MTDVGAMLKREVHPSQLVAHARRHEDGFDELWIVEDLPFAGGISQAATVLQATERVVVGHGIAPAPFRNPAALAMEWATLATLHPGRFAAGLGHGVPQWMSSIGSDVTSPLALLRETAEAVIALLAGEAVRAAGRYVTLEDIQLEFPPADPPRVSLGVTGPRSLRLSGAVGQGTVLPEGHGPAEIEAALANIAAGAAERDTGTGNHRLTVFVAFHVGDPATIAPRNPMAPTSWEAIGDQPSDVARRLQTVIEAGADAIVLVALGRDLDQQLTLAAEEVVPLLVR